MQKGELRNEILEGCPEECKTVLSDFIDKLEVLTSDIIDNLSIESISDIGNIEEAHRLAEDLLYALY
jgi:hypothetical protein